MAWGFLGLDCLDILLFTCFCGVDPVMNYSIGIGWGFIYCDFIPGSTEGIFWWFDLVVGLAC